MKVKKDREKHITHLIEKLMEPFILDKLTTNTMQCIVVEFK